MNKADPNLVGDIGATYARFCLVERDGTLSRMQSLASRDYATLDHALASYLQSAGGAQPQQAVLAIAATPARDMVKLTNNPWTFSIEDLRKSHGLHKLRVVNDFYAHAAAVPHLREDEKRKVGTGEPATGSPIGLIGPGTGLGVSALVPGAAGPTPVGGEGGHVTMAPADSRESAVLERMREKYHHVSAERLVSGPGLVNLYNVLSELSGSEPAPLTPAQITDPRNRATDACAKEATDMFCAMLGTLAGNLALTLGARGGIYIAGGIVPKLGDYFLQSQFRERFEAKGRMRSYLAAIPTYVVTHPWVGLLGASKLLEP